MPRAPTRRVAPAVRTSTRRATRTRARRRTAPGLDATAALQAMALPALSLLVGGWLAGAFAGGFVGTRIARQWRLLAGLVPGALIAVATWQWAQHMHPPRRVAELIMLLAIPMAWFGARLALRMTLPEPAVRGDAWRGHDR